MDSHLSSRLEAARALSALRKAWITPEQFRAILRCDPQDGSQLERLREEGALSPSRLAELYGSTVLLSTQAHLGRLGEAHLREAAPAERLDKGDWIAGRYRILDLRQGGFGRVYICEAVTGEAYSRGHSRVALKTPLTGQLTEGDTLERFQAEAARWIALGAHPNLVLAYGLEEHHKLPFVVMEYIEGARTLHQEIQQGQLPWVRVLWTALDVARGLAHAERALGLVHGDLKPLNLLVTEQGSVKVADFGLSLLPGAPGEEDGDSLAGTPGFMAPEMFLGHPQRTTATDLYAFGATLFMAATRRTPFPPREPWRSALEPPPDPRSFGSDLPAPLADVLRACLDPEPEGRPASFNALLRELESLHQDLLGREAPPSPEPDIPFSADAQVNLAVSWLNLGRTEAAEAAARQALHEAPGHWKALCALGEAQLRRGDAPAALASFESAHREAPEELAPLVNAALAAREAGAASQVLTWLQEALLKCQARGRYAELEPVSLLLLEQLPSDEALDLLDRIVAEDPAAVRTWNHRAILLRRQGRPDLALDSADQALAVNPLYAKAWSNRANALMELGRLAEALASASRALELDPRVAGAYAAKATALAQLDRLDDAKACIHIGLRMLPGDPLLLRAERMFGGG
ncbi:MAG TPA: serine/threonine-protein kinase [Holophagaceae bacterium]|nr:serine/threonine-protein kinase [Holophagaceae bacterium]